MSYKVAVITGQILEKAMVFLCSLVLGCSAQPRPAANLVSESNADLQSSPESQSLSKDETESPLEGVSLLLSSGKKTSCLIFSEYDSECELNSFEEGKLNTVLGTCAFTGQKGSFDPSRKFGIECTFVDVKGNKKACDSQTQDPVLLAGTTETSFDGTFKKLVDLKDKSKTIEVFEEGCSEWIRQQEDLIGASVSGAKKEPKAQESEVDVD